VKEPIFHPEARAELRESVEFYETRLDGLGLRFLAAVEGTAERISASPEAGSPLAGGFRKRIVLGFPYNIVYTVVRAIGANGPTVANRRLEEALCAPPPWC
jgi:hypothetical protein